MALPTGDAEVGHSFGLEVDSVQIKGIRQVSGLKMEQDVIEMKENGPAGEVVVRTLPGRWKSPEITLTRGLTLDSGFEKWVKDSLSGKLDSVRRSGAIVVYDYEGAAVKRYVFTNAWPKSLEILPLEVGDATILSERLVLVCDRLEPE